VKSIKHKTFGIPVGILVVGALVFAGTAFGVWTIFSSGHGTTGGTFATATSSDSVTLQQPTLAAENTFCAAVASGIGPTSSCDGPGGTTSIPLAPGLTTDLFVGVKINSGVPETLALLASAMTFSSTPVDCASHLSFNATALNSGSFPATGGSSIIGGAIPIAPNTGNYWYSDGNGGVIRAWKDGLKADATLPSDCSNGTYSITIPVAAVTVSP
jgi:hypothetical protein